MFCWKRRPVFAELTWYSLLPRLAVFATFEQLLYCVSRAAEETLNGSLVCKKLEQQRSSRDGFLAHHAHIREQFLVQLGQQWSPNWSSGATKCSSSCSPLLIGWESNSWNSSRVADSKTVRSFTFNRSCWLYGRRVKIPDYLTSDSCFGFFGPSQNEKYLSKKYLSVLISSCLVVLLQVQVVLSVSTARISSLTKHPCL